MVDADTILFGLMLTIASNPDAQEEAFLSLRPFVAHRLEPIEQVPLRFVDLVARRRKIEPFGAIDFRKGPPLAALRRPFDLEHVAADRRDIHLARSGKGFDDLAAALADFTERRERILK